MTGTLTPTRSCLKRRGQTPHGSLTSSSDAGTHSGSSSGSSSSRNSLCKTVSFDGEEHVYFCDPDYDRHSVPVAPKLSYEDLLELKMLNINLMCPQNNKSCSLVPIGILPLLPASDSSSSGTTSPGANPSPPRTKPVQLAQSHHTSPLSKHLSAQNQRFVGLLDDDLASMASSTPPPSSPSTCDHSPVMHPRGGAVLPLIATDDEGQLVFNFSEADEMLDSSLAMANDYNRRHNKKSNDVSMELSSPVRPALVNGPKRQCDASHDKMNRHETVAPPFPVPPSRSSSQFHNPAALTLTPSFFALAPQQPVASNPLKTENSSSSTSTLTSSSPFPFAPPVPTMAGLPGLPSLPALPHKSDTSMSNSSSAKSTPTSSTLASPTSPTAKQHQRSTSSSSSNSTTSPQATPHASPTTFVPLHAHMKSQRSPTPTNHNQAIGHPTLPGSLSALQHSKLQQGGHPRSPQLAGLPSPSLVPPSPLSLYPPGVDNHPAVLTSIQSANPGGFFGARRSNNVATAANHVKKSSISSATSAAIGKPASPVIKPLKS